MSIVDLGQVESRENPGPILGVPGLLYWPEFVTPDVAAEVVVFVDDQEHWIPFGTRKRRLPYGWVYRVNSRTIARPAPTVPPILRELAARLVEGGMMGKMADQVVVQDYPAGVGIGEHTDAPVFGPDVCSLSLLTPCVMQFRRPGESGRKVGQVLEPRSALALTGEARSEWTHEICGNRVPSRRLSITFRTVVDNEFAQNIAGKRL